jgi:hypothetical protein
LRGPFLAAQLEQLGIGPDTKDLKLHFGVPGLRRLDGWLNVEPTPAQLAMSHRWELPLPPGSVAWVYSAHTFEHLYYKEEALSFLRQLHRAMAKGAAVRIIVPDIEPVIEAYSAGDAEFFAARKRMKHFYFEATFETPLQHLLRYFGTGIRPQEFFRHKYGYDYPTLKQLLEQAGFAAVTHSSFNTSEFEALRIDHHCTAAHHRYKDRYLSLFVDAVRP